MNGFGPTDIKKYFSFLNFRTESFQKVHYYCEKNVGSVITELSQEFMDRKRQVERELSIKHFNIQFDE